jgi:hypothetical protein
MYDLLKFHAFSKIDSQSLDASLLFEKNKLKINSNIELPEKLKTEKINYISNFDVSIA